MKKAYPFLLALLTAVLGVVYLGNALAQETGQSPVNFAESEYVMDDIAAGAQEKLEVTLTNNQAFTSDSVPKIDYTSFKLNDEGQPTLVDSDGASKWLATDWINGPVRLTNLDQGETNILEVVIIIPENTETGAYRGAITINHPAWAQAVSSWVIINIGSAESDLQIVEPSDTTFLDFDENRFSVTLRNDGQHYIRPDVRLVLSTGDDGDQQEVTLGTQADIGILPEAQQVFTPVDEVSFDRNIVSHSDLTAKLVITDQGTEVKQLAFPDVEPLDTDEDDQSGQGEDDNQGGDSTATDPDTAIQDDESTSKGFLSGSVDWILVVGSTLVVILLTILLWLTMRHRSTRMPPGDKYKPQVIDGGKTDDDEDSPTTSDSSTNEPADSPGSKDQVPPSLSSDTQSKLVSDLTDETSATEVVATPPPSTASADDGVTLTPPSEPINPTTPAAATVPDDTPDTTTAPTTDKPADEGVVPSGAGIVQSSTPPVVPQAENEPSVKLDSDASATKEEGTQVSPEQPPSVPATPTSTPPPAPTADTTDNK